RFIAQSRADIIRCRVVVHSEEHAGYVRKQRLVLPAGEAFLQLAQTLKIELKVCAIATKFIDGIVNAIQMAERGTFIKNEMYLSLPVEAAANDCAHQRPNPCA